jgi:hypothetical protein
MIPRNKATFAMWIVSRLMLLGWAVTASFTACDAVSEAKAPQRVGAPHRLGGSTASINDAGVQVDEAGLASFYLDASLPGVLGEPAIDHCAVTSFSVDPPTGNYAAYFSCGGHAKLVQGTLTGVQLNALLNLAKAQFAVQYGQALQ